jgi:hypothetical protein
VGRLASEKKDFLEWAGPLLADGTLLICGTTVATASCSTHNCSSKRYDLKVGVGLHSPTYNSMISPAMHPSLPTKKTRRSVLRGLVGVSVASVLGVQAGRAATPDDVLSKGARKLGQKIKRALNLGDEQPLPLRGRPHLSDTQRALLPQGCEEGFHGLPDEKKAIFFILTEACDSVDFDLKGQKLKGGLAGIREDRLFFDSDPEAMARFKEEIRKGIAAEHFLAAKPNAEHHPGMSDKGVRENRSKDSLQAGVGPEGAFIDMDHWNPLFGLFHKLGHLLECQAGYRMNYLAAAQRRGLMRWRDEMAAFASRHGAP